MNDNMSLYYVSQLPTDLKKNIYYYFLDFYRLNTEWPSIHQQLKEEEQYLIMTEHLFDFEIDYHYITRIPALECCDLITLID